MSAELQKTYGASALQFVRDVIGKDYLIDSHIGSGSYGDVFGLKCLATKKCDRVVKIQYDKYEKIQSEINSQRYFASYGLAPRIFRTEAIRNKRKALAVIVMEKIDGVLTDILGTPLSDESLKQLCEVIHDIILKMCEIMALHGDLHWSNIGYKITSGNKIRLILIDFGFSLTESRCRPDLEISQLLRSLSILKRKVDRANMRYITDYFVRVYEDSYGKIQGGFNTLWERVIGQHKLVHDDAIMRGPQPASVAQSVDELTLERLTPRRVTELLRSSLKNGDWSRANRIIESHYGKVDDIVVLPDEYFNFISIGALFQVMTNVSRGEALRIRKMVSDARPEMRRTLNKIERKL